MIRWHVRLAYSYDSQNHESWPVTYWLVYWMTRDSHDSLTCDSLWNMTHFESWLTLPSDSLRLVTQCDSWLKINCDLWLSCFELHDSLTCLINDFLWLMIHWLWFKIHCESCKSESWIMVSHATDNWIICKITDFGKRANAFAVVEKKRFL